MLLFYNSAAPVVHKKKQSKCSLGCACKSFILIQSFLYASTPKYTIATTPTVLRHLHKSATLLGVTDNWIAARKHLLHSLRNHI